MIWGAMGKVLVGSALALVLAACGDDRGPVDAPTPSGSSPSVPPRASVKRWIAVIDVAPRPGQLDALTERLLDPLGTALVVSPTDCFQGLPDAAGDGYLIGAVGDSRSEVLGKVADAGEKAVFSANVMILCTD